MTVDGRAEMSRAEGAAVAGRVRLGVGQERDGRQAGNLESNDPGRDNGKYR